MPSSVVDYFDYDSETLTLSVRYVSGIVYKYKNVPEKAYKEMKASVSKGKYLNYKIKPNYEYEKVDPSE